MASNPLDIAVQSVDRAMAAGADAADVVVFGSNDVNVRERLGKPETIERSESRDLGLRVFVKGRDGLQQAIISSNDFSENSLTETVSRAVDMAKAAPADPYSGLAPSELLVKNTPELDICDADEVSVETLKQWAAEAEEAALAVKGVTNSEGSEASYGRDSVALATSNGFAHQYTTTGFSISASVIAGEGTAMETDYDYAFKRHIEDLKKPADIGKSAGERAVRRLNPHKAGSCQVPVIYESRVAKSLLGSFAGAINGASIARGTSFLKDKMNQQVFADDINITDDPLMKRGIASEPFDGEGVAGKKRSLIENGTLTTWLLDIRSANKLGLQTTGHASRSTSSPPSPGSSNLYMEAGRHSVTELVADIKSGFYITEAFGMGVNGVTGDYSQGASGFWIENGEITYPVSEVTIAGNLTDMFKNLTPANDLEMLYGTNSPTLRIEGMTVAGA